MNLPHMLVTCQAYAAMCEQRRPFIDEEATKLRLERWTLAHCMPFLYTVYTQKHDDYVYMAQHMQHELEQQLFQQLSVPYEERDECHSMFEDLLYPTASSAHIALYNSLPLPLYIDVLMTLHNRTQLLQERIDYKIALGQVALAAERIELAQSLFVCAWLDYALERMQLQLAPDRTFDWILQYNVHDTTCQNDLLASLCARRTFTTDFEYGLQFFLREPLRDVVVAEQCLALFSVYYPELTLQKQELAQIEQRFLELEALEKAPKETAQLCNMQQLLRLYAQQQYELLLPMLEQLAEKQHVFALSMLGKMYQKGQGVPQDAFTSYEYFKDAYLLGDDDAAMHLADVTMMMPRALQQQIVQKMHSLILENTSHESIPSCLIYGKWTLLHDATFDRAQAALLLEHAFLHGLQFEKMHAAYLLARLYEHTDEARAHDWYAVAEQYGLQQFKHLFE